MKISEHPQAFLIRLLLLAGLEQLNVIRRRTPGIGVDIDVMNLRLTVQLDDGIKPEYLASMSARAAKTLEGLAPTSTKENMQALQDAVAGLRHVALIALNTEPRPHNGWKAFDEVRQCVKKRKNLLENPAPTSAALAENLIDREARRLMISELDYVEELFEREAHWYSHGKSKDS